jgi:DNA-binding NarL/FixJ family response regulator
MESPPRIRVLCVDHQALVREGIATIINAEADMLVVAQASTGHDAIQMFREHRPDVTLLDLHLGETCGLEVLTAIRTEFSDARVIVVTTADGDADIQHALEAGACGYLLKSCPAKELINAIRQVHAGQRHIAPEAAARLAEHVGDGCLSDREVEVLQQVAGGNRNRDIAVQLFITEETVKMHLKNIMEKLGASDRTQAVAIALRRGFLRL